MNLNFKTICSAVVLCFVGNVFAMDSNSLKENSSNSKGFSQFIPIRQANSSTDINLVDIMKEIAKLRRQNKNLQKKNAGLQQQVEMYESVLDDVLDQTVHTRNKKVLENEYKKLIDEYEQLIEAVKNKDIKMLKSLIGQGVDIDETVFGNFSTPLKKAVKRGYTDVITFLLNNGADPNKAPEVLEFAVNSGDKDLVELALLKGVDPNKAPEVLEFAVNSGDKDLVELALLKGADPNKAPKVLKFSVNTGNKDLVELALAKGANPNKALKLAVNSGNKDLVELALLKGADPNVLDKENNSMLMLALKKEYIEIARLFLSNSCSDHILDFIYAGKSKQPMSNDSIKLKERLAIFKRYDTPNKKGESPLIQAIRTLEYSDLLGILTSLLKNKLVLNRIDSSTGYSVLTLAKLNERGEEIIKLLEDAGARDVYMDDYMPPAGNEKSPIVRLYEYCQDKSNNLSLSDLKFEYKIKPKGKFSCFITIDRGNGNDKDVYDNGESYSSKKEARKKIADYTLRKLMENEGLPVPDNRDPVKKLADYCLDKSTSVDLSDIEFLYGINKDGTFNCKIKLKNKIELKNEIESKDEIFDLNLHCKSKKEARKKIAEHVYNLLVAKAKNGEASSSGTN